MQKVLVLTLSVCLILFSGFILFHAFTGAWDDIESIKRKTVDLKLGNCSSDRRVSLVNLVGVKDANYTVLIYGKNCSDIEKVYKDEYQNSQLALSDRDQIIGLRVSNVELVDENVEIKERKGTKFAMIGFAFILLLIAASNFWHHVIKIKIKIKNLK